ncbi:MAG: hypothetical protein RLY70_571 [Planctomycetota bacterium]
MSNSASSSDGQDVRRTKRRFTTGEAHSATHASAFLVYRRAVGDGRASKPHSLGRVEFRFQQRRTRCPSYKERRFTTIEAHSVTPAPAFLVYRRAVGDGRASKPQSLGHVEFRFQQRRTRCPSYKEEEVHHDRSPLGNACIRFPRLPPSRRRRPGLQTAFATRCRIPLPTATDKMSVVQRGSRRCARRWNKLADRASRNRRVALVANRSIFPTPRRLGS